MQQYMGFCAESSLQPLKVNLNKIEHGAAGVGPYAHNLDFFNSYSVLVLENIINI